MSGLLGPAGPSASCFPVSSMEVLCSLALSDHALDRPLCCWWTVGLFVAFCITDWCGCEHHLECEQELV